MTKIVLAYLMVLVAPSAVGEDHLLPISPGNGVLNEKVDGAWLKVVKEDDVAFVRFDIRPAFDAMSHLAILSPGKDGPFRLCYEKGSYRDESPVCVPIGNEFATALATKVENIIRRDTHYSVGDGDVSPLDSTSYFFAANFVFAEVNHPTKDSPPRQLIDAFEDCARLAQMKSDDPGRQQLMSMILKELDAIKIPGS